MTYAARRHQPDPPTTPTRALDATFTPSTTKWTWCFYTIQMVITTGQSSTVEFRSDSATTPTTVRASATNNVIGTQRWELVYLVPPGDNVKLVSSGTGAATISSQTEITVA